MIGSLLHSTILGGQRGEDQKEQRVSGRVQSEIEKAVDQNSEAAGQRTGRHATSELVVSFAAGKALAEENHDKGQAERPADYSAVRYRLQIIVMRLFESKDGDNGSDKRPDKEARE